VSPPAQRHPACPQAYPATVPGHAFPVDHPGDEKELLLDWLGFLRGALARKASVEDRQAHWGPDGQLISLIGIVNHLTRVEWRWIDGGFLGAPVERSESEFHPGEELTIAAALHAYQERANKTDALVRSTALDAPCRLKREGCVSLRWVLLHLINETARHAGHADAVRELLDGTTGE
jgi:uncharacterized damage-inducible protein DinB